MASRRSTTDAVVRTLARRGIGVVLVLVLVAGASGASAQPLPAQFRGGGPHHGVVETTGVPRLGGVAWTFATGGTVRGSPTVADDVVYVGSSDGRLYALDAETGGVVWSYSAGAPVGGTPLVTDDLVVVVSRGNAVHAVDRRSGRPVWRRSTGPDLSLEWGHEGWDYLLPSPVLAGGAVLVGSGDGRLYALDPDDGRVRWAFRTAGRIRATPVVEDGVAYFGSGDGVVYGVDLLDGAERWRFRTAGADLDAADFGFDRTQIQGSGMVHDGTLFIGSRDASLYAIDLSSGDVLWTFEDGSAWVVNSPAYVDGLVLSGGSSSGRFRAIDAESGDERWVVRTGGPIFSSPTVVDGVAYVGSGDRTVYAVDVADGSIRWTFPTGGMVVGSPAVWNGRLFVGSDDGTVYALESSPGPAPRRAVYWDDGFVERSSLGSREAHRRLAEYFEGRGYERVDSAGVERFLQDRVGDGVPSVVVFGMDGVPSTVVDPSAPGSSLLRRYLDTGGKVVWPGLPPLMLTKDEQGRPTGIDRAGPRALLGVDFSGWDTDVYGAVPTDEGRTWGLTDWFVGSPGVHPSEATAVLAMEETGRAVAWVRSYGHAPGSGWVVVPAALDPEGLEAMRRVAEYGIFRRPDPRR